MANYGDSFLKRTGKSLSILAFETTKQSRIMKKRMRITALQKEVKADLRDLGSLVYNAVTSKRDDVLADEEVKILVENITENNTEIERLRDSIGRISQAKKHFEEGDEEIADSEIAEPTLDKPAEEPVVEEAPVEEPVAAEPVAEESSEEPAAEEPTEEQPTEEPAAEEANEEPTLEEASKPKRTRKASTTPRKRAAKKTAEGDDEEK